MITSGVERKLAAIMFTDMVGFSRQMGADEARMLRLLEVHNQIIQQAVAEHHGHVIKTIGDAFLADFPSVVNAVQCAQIIQAQLQTHNTEKEKAEQIHVRIGIHTGDIVQHDGDVFGDGVNIASRLQTLAEPDTICISQIVYKEVEKKLSLGTVVSLGKPKLKNIAERFQVYALLPESPKGLRQTLQVQRLKLKPFSTSLATVGLLLIGGILALLLFRIPHSAFRNQEALLLPDKPSIVVLPFVNMSNDPEQEYFSDGITEDITTDLSKIASLFVISRNSAFTYKGKSVKVQDVSKEMGVRYVLEGSVRKANDRVRITAQLVDGTTGGHLWSERYDRPLKDIFVLQDEIRQKVVFALKVKLTPDEQERFRRAPTDNLEAYDSLSRGREYAYRFTKEAHAQALQLYEQAIELDPKYAAAYAALSGIYSWEWIVQWSSNLQSLERAFELAQKAVALEDSLPLGHIMLGVAYLNKKQHEQAIAEVERAITLDPNWAQSYSELAYILTMAGRPVDAIPVVEKAIRLDPKNMNLHFPRLGRAYRMLGRYEEALVILKRAVSVSPNMPGPRAELVFIYTELGRAEEARAEVAEILRIIPNFSLEAWRQRVPYKNPADLERMLAALRKAGLK